MSADPEIPLPPPGPAPIMPAACRHGGCGGTESGPPPPSFSKVRVNGVEIAPEAIAQEIQHHPASDIGTAWRDAARALVIRELLLQEARRLEIAAAPETDEAGRLESEAEALVRALLDEKIAPEPPSETECRRFYAAQRDRFHTPDLFEAAHVLIEPAGRDEAAWAAAEARARAIIAAVRDDPQAFAEAARAFSACPSAHQDGSLGQVQRGDLVPPIQAALDALADGETHREPVRSRFGWHTIHLHRRVPGHLLPFEAVSSKIAATLAAHSWSVAAARYVAALAAGARIEGIMIASASEPGAF